jgi:hypothetical protein
MEGQYVLDGCEYEDLESYVCTGIFGFCGCVGESALRIIDKALDHFSTCRDKGTYWDDLVKEVFNGDEGSAYIVSSLLDNTELIEHGMAIRGSWLTDKGTEVHSDIKKIISLWDNQSQVT